MAHIRKVSLPCLKCYRNAVNGIYTYNYNDKAVYIVRPTHVTCILPWTYIPCTINCIVEMMADKLFGHIKQWSKICSKRFFCGMYTNVRVEELVFHKGWMKMIRNISRLLQILVYT